MVKKRVFDEIGGFDESLAVAFNDVDLCMKIRKLGYLIVFTPFAQLYHYESKSRGVEDTPEKVARFNGEANRFLAKWKPVIDKGDPYYNPNLTLEREDFSFK
jgi:GT2 family glycosyltransferase